MYGVPEERGDMVERASTEGEVKLYTVELAVELIVIAESEDDAILQVQRMSSLDVPKAEIDSVSETSWLPSDWDEDAIPFGKSDPADPDRTIRQWAEMGAAPKLKLRGAK